MTETECAYCTHKPFRDHGPNGATRGLCCKHAQTLAVDYSVAVGALRRAGESLNETMAYLKYADERDMQT